MPIVTNPSYFEKFVTQLGTFPRFAKIAITGLTAASANTIPHGLPSAPQAVILVPGAAGLWGETSTADATNIYITVGTAGATAGSAYVFY